MNKLDRPGASFRSSLLSILSHRIHPVPIPLAIPVASFNPQDYLLAEPGIEGIVDLVKWEVWRWTGEEKTCYPLPKTAEELHKTDIFPASHPLLSELVPARVALMDSLAMFSEPLMEELVNLPSGPDAYLSVPSSTLLPELRACTIRRDILPVLCGAAMKNIGTDLVLDYAGELLADPVTVAHEGDSASGPLRVLAWKVAWDKRRGWMTFVRVYSGEFILIY